MGQKWKYLSHFIYERVTIPKFVPWKFNSSTLHNIDERRNYTITYYLTNSSCDEIYIMILAVSLAAFFKDNNIKIWVVLLSGTWCTCCTKKSSRCSVSFNEWGRKNSFSHIFKKKIRVKFAFWFSFFVY